MINNLILKGQLKVGEFFRKREKGDHNVIAVIAITVLVVSAVVVLGKFVMDLINNMSSSAQDQIQGIFDSIK